MKIELENGNYKRLNYWDIEKTTKYSEIYYNLEDEIHRLDGPARIFYNIFETQTNETYFLNGIEYSKEDWIIESNKIINVNINLKLLNKE